LTAEADALLASVQPQPIEWRRHLHQYPELSNREAETAAYVAGRLRSFGLEPRTGIARHGPRNRWARARYE
jgi:amidohydrolase